MKWWDTAAWLEKKYLCLKKNLALQKSKSLQAVEFA